MSCARHLEEDLLLALEHNFAVVYAAGDKHEPVDIEQVLCAYAAGGGSGLRLSGAGNSQSHFLYFPLHGKLFPALLPGLIVTIRRRNNLQNSGGRPIDSVSSNR
jgi:hypothetical protein